MKSKSTFNNFIYQTLFQVVKVILPVITIPIVSKAFGTKGMGIIFYSNSILQYFLVFAALGTTLYFNRLIAEVRHDHEKLSKTFTNIFLAKFIVSTISLIIYLMFCYFFIQNNRLVFFLQAVYIVGAVFDVSWFFAGLENFKLTSLANLMVSLLFFCIIVIFVKSPSDIFLYVFLQAATVLFSQIPLYFILRKMKLTLSYDKNQVKKIIKESFKYLIPSLSIILYTALNSTVLGIFGTKTDVGLMGSGLNIINVGISLITTIDLVMIPKMSILFSKKDFSAMENNLSKTLNIQMLLTIPICLGIISIFPNFVPWFFGKEFIDLINLIWIIAPLVIIIPLGMTVNRQYLVPTKRIKEFNYSVVLGAIVNIILAFILTPLFGLIGMLFSRLISELMVTVTRLIFMFKHTEVKFSLKDILKTIVSSLIMFIVVYVLNDYVPVSPVGTIFQFIIGGLIFVGSSYVLKNEILFMFTKIFTGNMKIDRIGELKK